MYIELRQWYYTEEKTLIDLYDRYDRSFTDYRHPQPGQCSMDEASFRIRSYIDMLYEGYGFSRAIVVNGKVVGHVQLTQHSDIFESNCDLDIFLLPEVCGKGIATRVVKRMISYAFDDNLDFECLFATLYEGNEAAARVCEKAGLQKLGYEEDDHTLHGKPCRKVVYAIRHPKRPKTDCGVEIKPWKYRHINELAHLIETVDKRYVDVEDPIKDYRQSSRDNGEAGPTPDELRMRMAYKMHECINRWNAFESKDKELHRAIVNDGEIVGHISVCPLEGKRSIDARMEIMMMPEHCGNGIATEAVAQMVDEAFWQWPTLQHVTAMVCLPDVASARLFEKNGFSLEGTLREALLCEDKPTDCLIYGKLRKS